jgi:hypothetical protein
MSNKDAVAFSWRYIILSVQIPIVYTRLFLQNCRGDYVKPLLWRLIFPMTLNRNKENLFLSFQRDTVTGFSSLDFFRNKSQIVL